MSHRFNIGLIPILFMSFWSFSLIYLACEFGEQMTTHFENLEETYCQCHWYLFSLEMQRMFIAVLANVQQPIVVRSFGTNTPCTRAIFKKVCLDWNSINYLKYINIPLIEIPDHQQKLFLLLDVSSNRCIKSIDREWDLFLSENKFQII